ncbi:MAG: hypothetical protein D6736_19480 [Nitrospinota bacterium]|nr:MAG: hypothetical protein D6736_19480 [Nitrospinota bacterium]
MEILKTGRRNRVWSRHWKIGWACLLLLIMAGCASKPAYLRKATPTLENRWKVEEIDPSRFSEDEKAVYESRGAPTYVRLFRTLHTREKVYAWIYDYPDKPVEIVLFIDGRRVEDAPLDPNPSLLKESTRLTLRNISVIAGIVSIVPLILLLVLL